jgi:polyisoprenoid-binding protein YceI
MRVYQDRRVPLAPLILCAAILIVPLQAARAQIQRFYLNQEGFESSVEFTSAAKFQLLDGQSDDLEGYFDFDTDNPVELSGQIQLDMTTLTTGIDKRDEDMREEELETDNYQYATFEIIGIKGIGEQMDDETGYDCTVIGNFTLHGITKYYMEIPVGVALQLPEPDGAANLKNLKVRAEFSIQLDDFNIPPPTLLFLQLAETIDIKVEFTATTAPPEPDTTP